MAKTGKNSNAKNEYKTRIEQNNNIQSSVGTAEVPQEKSESSAKFELANMYVKGFLYTISGALIYSWIRCYSADETKDIVLALSSTLSGPLGFIIGYYFKARNE